ncbi:MAG: phage virion morphogenesis protein [Azoarcus sp.]|jgi:phage virion morphogenesis protein|nr:phage virion morphogenesis protein [Azoarcus sp.]
MISLTVESQRVKEILKRLADRLTPAGMRPAMKEIGEELLASTTARFPLGVAPDGSRWPTLSPDTVLARIKRGRTGTRPLIDTGQLANTIRYQIIDGGAGVAIGTNRRYGRSNSANASVHQFGTNRAGRNRNITIPARPFLGLSASDEDTVLDILSSALGDDAT